MKITNNVLIKVTNDDLINGTFTIPDGIVSIGDSAFDFCSHLESVIIPDSVISIGDFAFNYCESLHSVIIPDSVVHMGKTVFHQCKSLQSVILSTNLTSIEDFTFRSCQSLISITIPKMVTKIGNYAFSNCLSLKSINGLEGVVELGDRTFQNCKSLSSIELSENLIDIGQEAFSNCESLTSIMIPKKVKKIKKATFDGCHSLISISLSDSIESIETKAFNNCPIENINTPWGDYHITHPTTENVASSYLYLYVNSILQEKFSSLADFINTNNSIYDCFMNNNYLLDQNAIQKFKNLFYKMRRTYDINGNLFHSMDLEITDKFNLNTWNRIKNVFDWRDTSELAQSFSEMMKVFGLFENDSEKEKRISDFIHFFREDDFFLTSKQFSDLISCYSNMSQVIVDSFEKKEKKSIVCKPNVDIPTQFQPYLKKELSDQVIKYIKRLDGSYGKRINDFVKENYETHYFEIYQLKEEYCNNNHSINHLLFYHDLLGHINYSSLHRIFDGCELKFNPDFYHFFRDNLEFILQDEKLQSQVKNIQKNFEKMKNHYFNQSGVKEITLKQALDYLENITFDYHDGNYELALDVKRAGVKNEEAFLYYQKVFEENDVRKLSSLIKRSHIYEIDGYTIQAELLRKDDSFGMLVGEVNYTDCCQAFGDLGHNCMAHAVSSDDGGIFVTRLLKDGEWILLTESWDWQNNNIYCHDNIEGTPYFKKDERLKKAVAEVYRLDGEAIIEKSKEEVLKYIKTRRKVIEKSSLPNKEKELELLRELEQREVIRLVTVGSGNDDLGLSRYFQRSIQVNQEQIIASQRFTLENFQPVNYNSNQPYFDETHGSYTDSGIKQYMIAGSIEELCLGKLEPLVPIYRDERRVILEEKENIRNYTVNKIKNMEKEIYPKEMYQYQTSHQDDFSDSNIYLGEDWYLIYEEKEDNGIYISDLVKTTPTLGDEIKDQNQEIMKVIYDLVRKYDYIEADLKEDTSYLLYLINKKLGYFEQIGEDISYPFQNRNQQKEITEQEQEDILKQMKEIKKKKNPELIMHHIIFQKGKLFQLEEEEEAIKRR